MKILQINNHHILKGGSERVYFETGKLLSTYGHQVYYFSSSPHGTGVGDANSCIVETRSFEKSGFVSRLKNVSNFIYSFNSAFMLDKFIHEIRPDIAHLHIFYGHLSNSILPVLKKHKIPCVMTIHDYRLLCPVSNLFDNNGSTCEKCSSGNQFFAISNRCNRNNYLFSTLSSLECFVRDKIFPYEKYIDKFILVSQFSKEIHETYRAQMAKKIIQLYNFVDLDRYMRTNRNEGYYLYLGRISREKGVCSLLKAVQNTSCKLKIVGTGDQLANLQSEFSSCSNIEFCGFKSGIELVNLIQGAKFVCIPSVCYDNNPMSVIESFACGKPVIGANIGGIPELVFDNKTGFLFPPNDSNALRQLLLKCEQMSECEYLALSDAAYAFAVNNLSKEVHYSKLIKIYSDVIESSLKKGQQIYES